MPTERIISVLDDHLQKMDHVILVDLNGANVIFDELGRSSVLAKTSKRITVISAFDHPADLGDHIYITVSEEEMKTLLALYRSYEASDKLILLTDNRNYGTTWNYVSTGLLSPDEAFEAMLT